MRLGHRAGARRRDEELLAVVGSCGDTMSDTETLALSREYNETGRVLHPGNEARLFRMRSVGEQAAGRPPSPERE
jgi:hypothetical protein